MTNICIYEFINNRVGVGTSFEQVVVEESHQSVALQGSLQQKDRFRRGFKPWANFTYSKLFIETFGLMHGGRGTLLLVYFFFVKFLDFENSDSRRFVSALVAF